jgi:hypothetical protein
VDWEARLVMGVSIVMGVPQELAGWFISWKLPEKAVTLYGGFHKVGIPSSLDGLFQRKFSKITWMIIDDWACISMDLL